MRGLVGHGRSDSHGVTDSDGTSPDTTASALPTAVSGERLSVSVG